jgi:hypothetical protein
MKYSSDLNCATVNHDAGPIQPSHGYDYTWHLEPQIQPSNAA